MANRPQAAADTGPRLLWFSPPDAGDSPRRALTRERVVAEALTVISTDGAGALSMRALATRLGVVPAALYRHVRNKEQLLDLVVDGVLAEVDCQPGPALAWAEQVKVLAHRLRAVLEDHPGIAGLLKTRDPLGPHSLALAEAFLEPLQAAGLPQKQTALAFSLIYDYTLGFALSDRTTVNEQRVQDAATRRQLHTFFRSLPADRFPALTALGEHIWAGNRDQRFTASLDTLLGGIETAGRRSGRQTPALTKTRAAARRTRASAARSGSASTALKNLQMGNTPPGASQRRPDRAAQRRPQNTSRRLTGATPVLNRSPAAAEPAAARGRHRSQQALPG